MNEKKTQNVDKCNSLKYEKVYSPSYQRIKYYLNLYMKRNVNGVRDEQRISHFYFSHQSNKACPRCNSFIVSRSRVKMYWSELEDMNLP